MDNLASIASSGLVCDARAASMGARSIAYDNIKARRAQTPVPVGPGGTLADYVPFYFCPRSPMLYTIWRGNVPGAEGTQPDIVHLVLDAHAVACERRYVFTNGHAVLALSDFFDDLADLDEVDWKSVRTTRWGTPYDHTDETKRKKQSEFLVHRRVPWDLVREVVVMSEPTRTKVVAAIDGVAHRPIVSVRPNWYY